MRGPRRKQTSSKSSSSRHHSSPTDHRGGCLLWCYTQDKPTPLFVQPSRTRTQPSSQWLITGVGTGTQKKGHCGQRLIALILESSRHFSHYARHPTHAYTSQAQPSSGTEAKAIILTASSILPCMSSDAASNGGVRTADGGEEGNHGTPPSVPQLPLLLTAVVVKGFGRGSKLLGIPTG